jgi:adenine-specific DNA-methyltransferase
LQLGASSCGIVENSDFFDWWGRHNSRYYDAIVGNPPFIRYQTFPEPHRSRAMNMMEQLGLHPNRLTNIWVPFVVGSVARLRPGGRLAFVLPAELLQVSYSSQLRSYLTDRFKQITIIACNALFFSNAEQEVVLLLADDALATSSTANACKVSMIETRSVAEIVCQPAADLVRNAEAKTIYHDSEKWLKYFLAPREIEFMRELRAANTAVTLSAHASIDVGVVTGKNEFFVLRDTQVKANGLGGYTIPLVSRSAHLKGAKISRNEWKRLAAADDRVNLLQLNGVTRGKLPKRALNYVALGERAGVHKGFKCSHREPWYAVPSIWTPHGFAFRQIYDFPRFVLNQAGATSTDTIHRMKCIDRPQRVIENAYTHLVAASAEIEGRSYGGGVLELEPTEAERLLMPRVLVQALPLEECDRLIRLGRIDDVLRENDRMVLVHGMGLSNAECEMLRNIWIKMRDRRNARRRTRSASQETFAQAAE